MSDIVKWLSRMAAVVTGAVLAVVIPVHAWAATNGVADLTIEAARSRRRGFGFFPLLGGVCCLLVVGGIVLGLMLASKNRNRKR